ncbi:MAG: sigma-70 family RNA polymerase sigma factor [Candidatus Riflebacteria bacterium]|nr:sigma-70 family RNA polymerase sigma factor [Candidatus Riflebacteria bacterium]
MSRNGPGSPQPPREAGRHRSDGGTREPPQATGGGSPAAGDPSPEDLARQVMAGQTGAFAEIIRRYQAKIFGMALFYTRSAAAAEDVVQDVFVATYQSLGRYDPSRSFTNWILQIATNHCCKAIRRPAGAKKPLDEPSPFVDPLETQIDRERQAMVLDGLKQLPEDQRLVIWLFYFFERSYVQISEILEIPLHLVKIRLFRGKKALGTILRQHPGLDLPDRKDGVRENGCV